jgi:hypothetical protein
MLRLFSCLLLTIAISSGADAQENKDIDPVAIASSLSDAMALGSFSFLAGCQFVEELRSNQQCGNGSPSNVRQTLLDLSEVGNMELEPFQDMLALRMDLDVPRQSDFITWTQYLLLRREESFERSSALNERLLEEAPLNSSQVHRNCDGTRYTEKRNRFILFFDTRPEQWDAFVELHSQCRRADQ